MLRYVFYWALFCLVVCPCSDILLAERPNLSSRRDGQNKVVWVSAAQPDLETKENGEWATGDLFYRELYRQAILMTARDQFGLLTRDATLLEPRPDDDSIFDLGFFIRTVSGKHVDYDVLHDDEFLLEGTHEYAFAHNAAGESGLALTVYRWAQEDVVNLFKEAGFEPVESKAIDLEDVAVPVDIEELLLKMDPLSQFLAVRKAHQAIDAGGGTIGLLGALVRGYGNLCQLTEFYPMQMRVAFFARALLYSTRMIELQPESPFGLWYRGYAYMLCGRHQAAWWDFEKAETLDLGELELPSWMPLMEPAYKYDFHDLKEKANRDWIHQELAILLWYRSVECSQSQFLNLTIGKQCLELLPLSTRITNGMNFESGVSYRHRTSRMGIEQFRQLLEESVPDLVESDDMIKEAWADWDDRYESYSGLADLRDALLSASDKDHSDLSIATLARLIDEEVVTSIINRAHFLIDYWGVESGDFIDEAQPFFEGHPHALLIEACRIKSTAAPSIFQKVLQDYSCGDASLFTVRDLLLNRLDNSIRFQEMNNGEYRGQISRSVTSREIDRIYNYSRSDNRKNKLKYAGWMGGMFPYAPWRHRIYAVYDWENHKNNQEWLREHGSHPYVARACAWRFSRDGEHFEALKWFRKAINGAPEYSTYARLAALYWVHLDDQERALEVAEEFLTKEDFGLQHSQMSQAVAYTLLKAERFDEAEIWAKRAASSGSWEGEATLANWYYLTGDPESALEIFRQLQGRYGDQALYQFVVRTGLGDLDEAWETREQQLTMLDHYGREQTTAFYEMYKGDLNKSLERLMPLTDLSENYPTWAIVYAAAAADELGEVELRNEIWDRFMEKEITQQTHYLNNSLQKSIRWMKETLEGKEPPDVEAITSLWSAPGDNEYAIIHYIWGRFFETRGDQQRALVHYREAAGSTDVLSNGVQDAWVRLRKFDVDLTELKPRWVGLEAYAAKLKKKSDEGQKEEAEAAKEKAK